MMLMEMLLSHLIVLTVGLKQFAVGKKGLVSGLPLVLLQDTITDIVITHHMLQEHYLQGLLGFHVSEFAIVDR